VCVSALKRTFNTYACLAAKEQHALTSTKSKLKKKNKKLKKLKSIKKYDRLESNQKKDRKKLESSVGYNPIEGGQPFSLVGQKYGS
jgi:hypothetical protein